MCIFVLYANSKFIAYYDLRSRNFVIFAINKHDNDNHDDDDYCLYKRT